ncbi:hypothetical protein J7L05_09465 [bacterium]|nr:hypothetical protein [bacterium]
MVDERKRKATWNIDTLEPPTYNIEMDVCDWVIVSNPYLEFVYDIFGNQYFTHAALVGYCGDDQTAYNGPRHYEWVGGHPDRSGPDGYSDGFIDLWDATVYEAIGTCWYGFYRDVAREVKHYPYSRAFINPGRESIQAISFNYSPAVWDDPNWFNIIVGIWEYAMTQNDCRWGFLGVGKEHYGTPA